MLQAAAVAVLTLLALVRASDDAECLLCIRCMCDRIEGDDTGGVFAVCSGPLVPFFNIHEEFIGCKDSRRIRLAGDDGTLTYARDRQRMSVRDIKIVRTGRPEEVALSELRVALSEPSFNVTLPPSTANLFPGVEVLTLTGVSGAEMFYLRYFKDATIIELREVPSPVVFEHQNEGFSLPHLEHLTIEGFVNGSVQGDPECKDVLCFGRPFFEPLYDMFSLTSVQVSRFLPMSKFMHGATEEARRQRQDLAEALSSQRRVTFRWEHCELNYSLTTTLPMSRRPGPPSLLALPSWSRYLVPVLAVAVTIASTSASLHDAYKQREAERRQQYLNRVVSRTKPAVFVLLPSILSGDILRLPGCVLRAAKYSAALPGDAVRAASRLAKRSWLTPAPVTRPAPEPPADVPSSWIGAVVVVSCCVVAFGLLQLALAVVRRRRRNATMEFWRKRQQLADNLDEWYRASLRRQGLPPTVVSDLVFTRPPNYVLKKQAHFFL
ncbi:unnamed protein product (mitochondrion) [Plasmodiophora brassicae]|uniref:Uncharacterized protein n=1 Tax=Plasmodiophora brassicae TaxID=37360 RepID=A0A0G4J6L4_PLABS|nr:hypothetical protein PBRA_009252 [Plasmodiophora brassicae]SPR01529.1 unnamed protein product [Plasmodiophora brassicae]